MLALWHTVVAPGLLVVHHDAEPAHAADHEPRTPPGRTVTFNPWIRNTPCNESCPALSTSSRSSFSNVSRMRPVVRRGSEQRFLALRSGMYSVLLSSRQRPHGLCPSFVNIEYVNIVAAELVESRCLTNSEDKPSARIRKRSVDWKHDIHDIHGLTAFTP